MNIVNIDTQAQATDATEFTIRETKGVTWINNASLMIVEGWRAVPELPEIAEGYERSPVQYIDDLPILVPETITTSPAYEAVGADGTPVTVPEVVTTIPAHFVPRPLAVAVYTDTLIQDRLDKEAAAAAEATEYNATIAAEAEAQRLADEAAAQAERMAAFAALAPVASLYRGAGTRHFGAGWELNTEITQEIVAAYFLQKYATGTMSVQDGQDRDMMVFGFDQLTKWSGTNNTWRSSIPWELIP